ncbi:uncharacterized protein sS8_2002 [Methylocaldum marinum]|uniref:Cobalt transporter subunit CbtB n=1 Tax=Methylocaldum marinum TaxID=1432792 RepID=A0A250KR00_9GAMM|nr:CbtB-domain containing protein [Methylocaldum marinum]BBA33956.1 uncharacterized protein sS8_2002 [Methylocaldum marinum]
MVAQPFSDLTEASRLHRIIASFSAVLLGSLLILIVGFAPVDAVHNAAHDTRHSADFPCH